MKVAGRKVARDWGEGRATYGFPLFPGCLNGGGQIRPDDGESSRELINRLDELYNSLR